MEDASDSRYGCSQGYQHVVSTLISPTDPCPLLASRTLNPRPFLFQKAWQALTTLSGSHGPQQAKARWSPNRGRRLLDSAKSQVPTSISTTLYEGAYSSSPLPVPQMLLRTKNVWPAAGQKLETFRRGSKEDLITATSNRGRGPL